MLAQMNLELRVPYDKVLLKVPLIHMLHLGLDNPFGRWDFDMNTVKKLMESLLSTVVSHSFLHAMY